MRTHSKRSGFTLVELMVAVSISGIVMVGMITVFVWTLRRASESQQYAWAQTEALQVSQRMVSFLRNATGVVGIDTNGNWVEVSVPPSNFVARLAYTNASETTAAGRLLFVANRAEPLGPTNELAKGIVAQPATSSGRIFEQISTNTLRLAFQIIKPGSSGAFPAQVDVGVQLRNN